MTAEKKTVDLTHKPKALVQEALDTIRATFWIQSKEFTFAQGHQDGYDDTQDWKAKYDWSAYDSVSKSINVPLGDDWNHEQYIKPGTEKAKVTGVCSIGALALANVTLYDEPLEPFEGRATWDLGLYLAGAAMAKAIWTGESGAEWFSQTSDHSGAIASWNDATGRTREEVIELFEKTLKDPLLTMEEGQVPCEITRLRPGKMFGDIAYSSSLIFATEAEAAAFIESHSVLLENKFGDDCVFQTRPLEHESLTLA